MRASFPFEVDVKTSSLAVCVSSPFDVDVKTSLLAVRASSPFEPFEVIKKNPLLAKI